MKLARTFAGPTRGRVAAFAFVVALVVTSAARAQSPTDQAEAELRQGTELRHQNQDARALPHFERAYGLARNPRTAAQLGLVKMALGYCVDAERLLDEALAVPDHPWIARNLDTLNQTRTLARKNVGEVIVTGTPVGAEVLLNGHPAGKLPLPAPLRLDKGPVEIQIRAPAHVPITRSLKVTAGGSENLWVALSPAPGTAVSAAPAPAARPTQTAPAQTPASAPTPESLSLAPTPAATSSAPALATQSAAPPADGSSPLRPLAWTAAAVATAGLVLGIVETVVARDKSDAFNNHTSPATGAPDCAVDQLSDACRGLGDAHDRARTLAIVGYIGAGVLATTSATLFILSNRRASAPVESPTLACAPALPTPGVSCRLTF